MTRQDTIAAIATAPGRGGVAIVRVSGPDAFAVAHRLTGRDPKPGRISFAIFRDANGAAIDSGIVLAFAAPHGYTGEDTVEFQGHGGTISPRRLLEACFAAGARAARRGEFTERAFLNGKMDLSAAEGVLELVDAKTDRAADDAIARVEGASRRKYRALYDMALDISGTFEHALDVDEGELPDAFLPRIAKSAAKLDGAIAATLRRASGGRILREGALVVLAGAPNAGKSSLMNALVGESRAIVSSEPGTTRDAIEDWLDVDGWPVRLTDTAGLREAVGVVEAEGVRRAEDLVAKADVVLLLRDGTAMEDDAQLPPTKAAILRIATKSDLKGFSARSGEIAVSSHTFAGLNDLRVALTKELSRLCGGPAEEGATVSERERALLENARNAISQAANTEDIVLKANSMRVAAEKLGALVGGVYADDLLDALFSRFCVGK